MYSAMEYLSLPVMCLSLVQAGFHSSLLEVRSGASIAEARDYCQLETFQAECSEGQVVVLTNALYGRMRLGRCVLHDYGHVGECVANVLGVADGLCSGRLYSCSFPVSTVHRYQQPCPGDLTPYFEASFLCLTVFTGSTQEVCILQTPIRTTEPFGYLASSVTTENGKGSPDCPWRIQVDLGLRINITLVYFHGRTAVTSSEKIGIVKNRQRSRSCYKLALIQEAQYFRTLTECDGAPRYSHAYMSATERVDVSVLVTSKSTVYFLLYYEGVGCADPKLSRELILSRDGDELIVRCDWTGETWRLTCSASSGKWKGQLGNCSPFSTTQVTSHAAVLGAASLLVDSGQNGRSGFPFGVLVVVTCGVAGGIVIGGLLIAMVASRRLSLTGVRRRCSENSHVQPMNADENNYSLHPSDTIDSISLIQAAEVGTEIVGPGARLGAGVGAETGSGMGAGFGVKMGLRSGLGLDGEQRCGSHRCALLTSPRHQSMTSRAIQGHFYPTLSPPILPCVTSRVVTETSLLLAGDPQSRHVSTDDVTRQKCASSVCTIISGQRNAGTFCSTDDQQAEVGISTPANSHLISSNDLSSRDNATLNFQSSGFQKKIENQQVSDFQMLCSTNAGRMRLCSDPCERLAKNKKNVNVHWPSGTLLGQDEYLSRTSGPAAKTYNTIATCVRGGRGDSESCQLMDRYRVRLQLD